MGFMNISLLGEAFSDYHLEDVGSSAYELEHDWFTREDLVITTGAGGGGTPLSEGVDYQLSEEDTDLSERVTEKVGSTRTVYHKVQIINATYQTGDVYHSGKYIADSNEAADIDYRAILEVSSEDYTVRDDDGYGRILVTTGASDRTITLPTAADNEMRMLTIVKADSGAGKVIVDGESTETINGVFTWWLVSQYHSITIMNDGSIWRKIGGHIPLLHIEDQKSSGTNGGTFTSGAWRTRDLNTVVTNEIAGASLSSNQITLPAGTYEIQISAPTHIVNRHLVKWRNISDSIDVLWGTSQSANSTTSSRAFLKGIFTLVAEKTFEVQHRCQTTGSSTGFGVNAGSVFTVDHETYTQVWIKKVA